MKQQLLRWITAAFFILGISACPVYASQTADIDGTYRATGEPNEIYASETFFWEGATQEDRYLTDFTIIINDGAIEVKFEAGGTYYQTTGRHSGSSYDNHSFILDYMYNNCQLSFNVDGNRIHNGILNYYDQAQNKQYWIEISNMIKEEGSTEPEDPVYRSLETSFMLPVNTSSGQYQMYISGFITQDLIVGSNELTETQFKSQNISIHVKNTVTGEYRVMTSNTIEGMTIDVGDDGWARISFTGRVQTSGGTLERYDAATGDLAYTWLN